MGVHRMAPHAGRVERREGHLTPVAVTLRPRMYFTHSSAVWEQFPQLVPGVLVLDNVRPEVDVSALLDPWYERARERLRRG